MSADAVRPWTGGTMIERSQASRQPASRARTAPAAALTTAMLLVACTAPTPVARTGPPAGGAQARGLDAPADALDEAVARQQRRWQPGTTVLVGNFVDAEDGNGSAFGRYLERRLGQLLAQGRTQIVDRRRLEQDSVRAGVEPRVSLSRGIGGVRTRPQAAAAAPPPVAPTPPSPEAQGAPPPTDAPLPADAPPQMTVCGEYRVEGQEVVVHLHFTDAGSGETAVESVRLPLPRAQAAGALLPPNAAASRVARDALATPEADFKVAVWVDRGAGAVYEFGDPLVILVRADRDCYVKVVHISADGAMQVVFPNKFDRDNRLSGGAVHRLGGPDYAFHLAVHEPEGAESLHLFAATQQFADMDDLLRRANAEGVASLGEATAARIDTFRTRGLSVVAPPSDRATSSPSTCLRATASVTYAVVVAGGQ